MGVFALLGSGLQTESQEEVREKIVARLRATFGSNLEVSTSSIMGQLVDILAELHAYDQQIVEDVWASFDADGATQISADRIAKITQTFRRDATKSTAPCTFRGTDATVITNGSQVRLDQTQTVWLVIGGPYTIGAVISGEVSGTVEAQNTGPVPAVTTGPAGWTILTPIVGWDTFESDEDADLGADQESDKLLKQRREIELSAPGQGPLAAIAAAVSQITAVNLVNVYHNQSVNPIDSDGIPFKAFNVVVETTPATPTAAIIATIALAIWNSQGAGGEAFGTDHVTTITDSEGNVQPVAFDLLAEVNMHIRVTATTSTSEEPQVPNLQTVVTDGTLLALRENHEDPGQDALPWQILGEVQALDLTGVDQLVVEISDDGAAWQTTKYAIGIRQRADWDSSRFVWIEN